MGKSKNKAIKYASISQIKRRVIPKLNSPARMVVALPNYGCATLTMIAAMTQMNQPICVANGIVPLDGNGALVNPTIVAYPNGCSAMEKTIAVTTAMNYQRTVPFATVKPISSVPITGAYQSKLLLTKKLIKKKLPLDVFNRKSTNINV